MYTFLPTRLGPAGIISYVWVRGTPYHMHVHDQECTADSTSWFEIQGIELKCPYTEVFGLSMFWVDGLGKSWIIRIKIIECFYYVYNTYYLFQVFTCSIYIYEIYF